MPHPYRRASIHDIIVRGDISITVLLGGLALLLGAGVGLTFFRIQVLDSVITYKEIWLLNCMLTGIAMWWATIHKFPPLRSLLIGGWISVLWTWDISYRLVSQDMFMPISNMIYVLIGLLIIHRSARR